jgi:C4-dicarboxylate transporter DctM subunit
MIMFIITAAAAFSWLLTSQQIPQGVATWMNAAFTEPWMFLLAVNVLLLVVGCFMEPNSAILVLAPLFFPVVQALGIDPIHFGIIMIVNLELGMITPPLGLNLFVSAGMTGWKLERVVRASVPFMVSMLAYLVVVTYVPKLSTFLPALVGGP